MRARADTEPIHQLMEALALAVRGDVSVYLVGGTTAVLVGWRATTIDVDFVMRPEDDTDIRPSMRRVFAQPYSMLSVCRAESAIGH